ncbi:DUF4282 domain-containing protein [Alloalcanivorax gelatiniphagus]|uniref:DUF4282 domain-containing protein n=1 Tax=Alloalcanivorax gelatiniphagus TaxID=1194167 RepID=A0ABY2XMQ0_9GAMM|nr:DUF4282 domain-containing protein [Alloalcanivorax gelatiniphagus]TMW13672.1 DUF4282 domain-containing protein [Alloalcanivorax gelatiniphagus]|tara:strand:+ start:1109 stop:1636 length:528 start_codon:yes stop_codon:yes gene_type:complete
MVDEQGQDPTPPENGDPPQAEAVNERLRRGWFWAMQYWRELFNFRFDKYMIIQVIPGVYGVALTAMVLGLIYLCVEAFMASAWRGVFFLFVGGPLLFLFFATLLRALLEFYMVVFRISAHVDQLAGLRDTVDRLSGIGDSVDEMVAVTRRIPFWRVLSSRRRNQPPPRDGDGDRD